MRQYVCIGVPYYLGDKDETRTEVAVLERSGIENEIGAEWVNISPDFDSAPNNLVAVNRALADAIVANADKIPLIFASDCCSVLGAIKGLERKSPAVVWLDAHGDFNTEETTPSGFLGGMPLAWLVGDGDQQYMQGLKLTPVSESDVIISDARDLDPEEAVRVENSQMTHLPSIDDLLTYELPDNPLYIHMDTDVVDIEELPGMNYPAPDGPSLGQTNTVLKRLSKDGDIAGILFTLWNDALPTEGKSLSAVLSMVRAIVNR